MGILFILILLITLLGLVRFGLIRMEKNIPRSHFLNLSYNRENTVGQSLILLGILFFGESLLLLNRNLSGITTPLWIIFITLMIALIAGYFLETLYPVLFAIVLLPVWWVSQSLQWVQANNIKSPVVLSGIYFIIFLLYIAGRMLEKSQTRKNIGMAVNFISIVMLSVFIFILSTKYGLSIIEGNKATGSIFLSFPLTFFLLLFVVSALVLFIFASCSKTISLFLYAETIPFAILFILFTSFFFIRLPDFFTITPSIYQSRYKTLATLTTKGIVWAVLLNILSVLQLLWVILLGYYRKENVLINLGAFFVLLFVIFKYFACFDFLSKGIFLLGGGILLFIAGYFMERGRKIAIKKISGDIE